jgi:hypothetical protein
MSAAANGQQLLRRGERYHCRRWQQCPENTQQQKRRKPPHAVSVHSALLLAQQLQWPWTGAPRSPTCPGLPWERTRA